MIATGALQPKVAVALSGVLNFVGAFLSLGLVFVGLIYRASRRDPVDHSNVNDEPAGRIARAQPVAA